MKPESLLNLSQIELEGVNLAKRPTGGGIIFHLWDLAFSFLVPASHPNFSLNTMENYALVNRMVMQAIASFLGGEVPELLPQEPLPLDEASRHFCMAKPTQFDVMVGGRKVGGAAQRRTKHGFLHQGTISIAPPDWELIERCLKPGTAVVEAMQHHTYCLLPNCRGQAEIEEARQVLLDGLKKSFKGM